jgi:Raf kinase inhibitor-like YbhB/YbcL family protein
VGWTRAASLGPRWRRCRSHLSGCFRTHGLRATLSTMNSTLASTFHRIAPVTAGLAVLVALVGCGGHGGSHMTAPMTPKVTTLARTVAEAPADGPLTMSSPAFPDGAPIPAQYTCKGAGIAPPLTWSAPLGAALVVDDPDAPRGPYIHWIVVGIPPGPGSTADGQTPAGASSLPNSVGQAGYGAPCPPAGSGVHHYRFTLYQLPATYQLPPGLVGAQAAQAITQAASGQAQFTGTVGG